MRLLKNWPILAVMVGLLAWAPLAYGQSSNLSDREVFEEFRQIVSSFSSDEQVDAWEAFIVKYPNSRYISAARQAIDDLKAGRTPRSLDSQDNEPTTDLSALDPDVSDMDLDFLENTANDNFDPFDSPDEDSDPFASSVGPDFSESNDDSFFDAPIETRGSSDSGFGSANSNKPMAPMGGASSAQYTRPKSKVAPWDRSMVVEVSPYIGGAPDEVYVRNTLIGSTIGLHMGRFFAEADVAGVAAQETPFLLSLKETDSQPEIITSLKFIAGGNAGYKFISGPTSMGNSNHGHDLFVQAGAGLVHGDVEICRENTDGIKCAAPLFIPAASFPYGTVGAGYRYYFTNWLGLRTNIRYRTILEIVDGAVTPRGNFLMTAGASFLF